MANKISVAICTYNGELFINQQIDSILTQSIKINEIIVCDDVSNDNTISILNSYKEKNPEIFQIYLNNKTLKSVKNFEKAISLCTGDFIFLSDQDDIWSKTKVAKYLEFFNENPDINVIASNGYCINEKSEVEDKYAIWDAPEFLREKKIQFNYFQIISYISNIATGASFGIRKTFVTKIIPFPIIKNFHHDEWIALIASSENSFVLLNEKYFYYRIHQNQQVGGIFYEKTEDSKDSLIRAFDLNSNKQLFKSYKRQLKKLSSSYRKNQKNLLINKEIYKELFEKNLIEIRRLYKEQRILMKKKFPLQFTWMVIYDLFTHKRKIN